MPTNNIQAKHETWEEMTVAEKLDALLDNIRTLEELVESLQETNRDLRQHQHSQQGTVFVAREIGDFRVLAPSYHRIKINRDRSPYNRTTLQEDINENIATSA